MEREKLGSRLGFILLSAGCAIGLGNVWRFPFIVGQYGGAAFILLYLIFLVILGLPVMVMLPSDDFDLCPLQDVPELPRTGNLEDVRLALATAAPLNLPPDYLDLDPALPRWRRLLGL